MKGLALLGVCFFSLGVASSNIMAQPLEPVSWSFEVNKIGENAFEIMATATIDKGWHLYSQLIEEGGPIPTAFYFEGLLEQEEVFGEAFSLKMFMTEEGESATKFDNMFQMDLKWFDNKAVFKQTISTSKPMTLAGFVEFMTCDDKRCLPPAQIPFEFTLNPN